jgi:hypothetical protein
MSGLIRFSLGGNRLKCLHNLISGRAHATAE